MIFKNIRENWLGQKMTENDFLLIIIDGHSLRLYKKTCKSPFTRNHSQRRFVYDRKSHGDKKHWFHITATITD